MRVVAGSGSAGRREGWVEERGFVEDAMGWSESSRWLTGKTQPAAATRPWRRMMPPSLGGGFWVEDGENEFGGEFAIDFDAGLDELVEVHGALEGAESAEAFGGEL